MWLQTENNLIATKFVLNNITTSKHLIGFRSLIARTVTDDRDVKSLTINDLSKAYTVKMASELNQAYCFKCIVPSLAKLLLGSGMVQGPSTVSLSICSLTVFLS